MVLSVFLTLAGLAAAQALVTVESKSPDGLWNDIDSLPLRNVDAERAYRPGSYRTVRLDVSAFQNMIAGAPAEFKSAGGRAMTLPMPDGRFERFEIVESSILAAELAAQFPAIKTFSGNSLDNPAFTARLDWTPAGFQGMVIGPGTSMFIEPYDRGDITTYISYFKSQSATPAPAFQCFAKPSPRPFALIADGLTPLALTSGPVLRTYRLALAATGEYTTFHGGTVAGALASMTSTMNRVNGIWERDFGIRLVLIADEARIIYSNPATDPYTNSDSSKAADENQANLDSVIGNANYDVGHVFTTGAGGVGAAGICVAGGKGLGATGHDSPVGDKFDVEYVAHEMVHQFSGNHTFNSIAPGCGVDNRNASTAFEPGSGSTTASYAGLCEGANLQSTSDDYFHSGTYGEVLAYITTGEAAQCAVQIQTGNRPPVLSAGSNYTIPRSTPFTLTATGTDPDGDTLTYTWEQIDAGAASPPETDDGTRAIFRSYPPTTNPSRTFPQLRYLLENANVPPATYAARNESFLTGEQLPITSRTMKFRALARDNRKSGGGVATADIQLTVSSASGPFRITQPNTALTWAGGSTQAISWEAAGTASAPVSAANVKITMSTDGGQTFPVTVLASAPNNGSASVTVPNTATTQGRIKVEGLGNVFFDVSDTNFTVTASTTTTTENVRNFVVAQNGGTSLSTSGSGNSVAVGSVRVRPGAGSSAPSGLAVFGFRQNGVLVTEAAVTATPAVTGGRIYAEVNGPVNTGLAIANPNDQAATITFFFTDANGVNFGNGSTTVPARGQIAAFLNQTPFNGGNNLSGTLTFNSTAPVSAVALRGFTNERSDFLLTTLPVVALTPAVGDSLVLSHFADGSGWTTQLVFVNPTDDTLTGTVRFFSQGSPTTPGAAISRTVDGQSASSFTYAIPPRSSRRLKTAGTGDVVVGSVRVDAAAGSRLPSGLSVFSFKNAGVTVTEAGVQALEVSSAQRMYAELAGTVQTGFAIANPAGSTVPVTFELTTLAGAVVKQATVNLPGNGQTAMFLNQIPGFDTVQSPFQGLLRITTTSTAGLAVVGLRGTTNERSDFLITTTPPVNEKAAPVNSELFFPHFADGGGYTTKFILYSGAPGQSLQGSLLFYNQSGQNIIVSIP